MESLEDLQEQIKALQLENANLSLRKEAPSMLPIYMRVTELCFAHTHRKLSIDEKKEMNESLVAYANHLNRTSEREKYRNDLLDIQTLSIAAHIVGDFGYLHEICAREEELKRNYKEG